MAPRPRPVEERFWPKVDKNAPNGCWQWTAGTFRAGYGSFNLGRGQGGHYAHRIAWELLRGPIPDGMQLDHLCLNKRCVNPDHLEVVTLVENVMRAGPGSHYAERTHCKYGHEYTPENTRLKRLHGVEFGARVCRACVARRSRESIAQKRTAV